MIGINGNDPLFGFGGIKKTQSAQQKPQVNNDVPIGKSQEVKDYGFELLEQGFYPNLKLSTQKPLAQATVSGLTDAPFINSLNELQGIENSFESFAMTNIKGVDPDKLARYMNKPLDDATSAGVLEYMEALA